MQERERAGGDDEAHDSAPVVLVMIAARDHATAREAPVVARLLFLSASANRTSPLAVDLEFNRVREGLVDAGAWEAWHPAVEHVPAASWEQLPRELLGRASIVHFSGHGHPDGSLE